MYRTCIFCSADLGTNESIEAFPVGRSVAFDAPRGRLWAVCGKCCRWNLAPLEERWEAVEDAERRFRDSRLRVQSENIGLCKLPDGTRLIRVGEALAGELAAWRYGTQLVRRRRQYILGGVAVGAAGLVAVGGLIALQIGGGLGGFWSIAAHAWEEKQQRKVIHRIPAALSPTGREVAIRRWHVQGARLAAGDDGGVALHVPDVEQEKRKTDGWGRVKFSPSTELMLPADQARAVLNRAMVLVNKKGASRDRVGDAVRLIEGATSAEAYLRQAALRGGVLGKREGMEKRQLTPVAALALEMALHDEQERRAMEGELAGLEAAWRQAEEIAAIADALPDHLPPSEPPRLHLRG
ncbi:hypothetical protein [Longimicrobium sp.]|uniref:hypothetical protein n=1 Tax=Longimicrobium sp. TaxID=2029185 RepID=UPI002E3204CC|nr:hypothetical protein [Longimicrobium sp.]HEX6039107.1 hypothetical protein [Longimicrobium sp.]